MFIYIHTLTFLYSILHICKKKIKDMLQGSHYFQDRGRSDPFRASKGEVEDNRRKWGDF